MMGSTVLSIRQDDQLDSGRHQSKSYGHLPDEVQVLGRNRLPSPGADDLEAPEEALPVEPPLLKSLAALRRDGTEHALQPAAPVVGRAPSRWGRGDVAAAIGETSHQLFSSEGSASESSARPEDPEVVNAGLGCRFGCLECSRLHFWHRQRGL